MHVFVACVHYGSDLFCQKPPLLLIRIWLTRFAQNQIKSEWSKYKRKPPCFPHNFLLILPAESSGSVLELWKTSSGLSSYNDKVSVVSFLRHGDRNGDGDRNGFIIQNSSGHLLTSSQASLKPGLAWPRSTVTIVNPSIYTKVVVWAFLLICPLSKDFNQIWDINSNFPLLVGFLNNLPIWPGWCFINKWIGPFLH